MRTYFIWKIILFYDFDGNEKKVKHVLLNHKFFDEVFWEIEIRGKFEKLEKPTKALPRKLSEK